MTIACCPKDIRGRTASTSQRRVERSQTLINRLRRAILIARMVAPKADIDSLIADTCRPVRIVSLLVLATLAAALATGCGSDEEPRRVRPGERRRNATLPGSTGRSAARAPGRSVGG